MMYLLHNGSASL